MPVPAPSSVTVAGLCRPGRRAAFGTCVQSVDAAQNLGNPRRVTRAAGGAATPPKAIAFLLPRRSLSDSSLP